MVRVHVLGEILLQKYSSVREEGGRRKRYMYMYSTFNHNYTHLAYEIGSKLATCMYVNVQCIYSLVY